MKRKKKVQPLGKPQNYWGPAALASWWTPGPRSVAGYKIGRMRGYGRAKSIAEGAREEGKGRVASAVGSVAGVATGGRKMLSAGWGAVKALGSQGLFVARNVAKLPLRAKPLGVIKGLWGLSRGAVKTPAMRKMWARQFIGGWGAYGLSSIPTVKAYDKAKHKSAAYWRNVRRGNVRKSVWTH